MKLEDIRFPLYVVHSDEVIRKKADLKYHPISKVEQKEFATLIWIKGIPFPFEVPRPPKRTETYAGVLYVNRRPAYLYELATQKWKDTWRKV